MSPNNPARTVGLISFGDVVSRLPIGSANSMDPVTGRLPPRRDRQQSLPNRGCTPPEGTVPFK